MGTFQKYIYSTIVPLKFSEMIWLRQGYTGQTVISKWWLEHNDKTMWMLWLCYLCWDARHMYVCHSICIIPSSRTCYLALLALPHRCLWMQGSLKFLIFLNVIFRHPCLKQSISPIILCYIRVNILEWILKRLHLKWIKFNVLA